MKHVRWGIFNLNDPSLFSITSTKSGIDKIKLNTEGNPTIPFVTRSEKNNGINEFIPEQKKPTNDFNTISIGLDTQTVFYQPTQYYTGQNIQVLSVAKLNTEIALFLIPLLKIQLQNLSWGGSGATLTRLLAKRILLPQDEHGLPDWDYMEQYVVNITNKIEIPKLEVIEATAKNLNSVDWKEFRISDVMDVLSGVRLTTSDMTTGDIPFIGATDSNNGITNWTSDINSSTDSNVLGVNYNGSVGETFYHPYTATFSDDVKRLKIKEHKRQSKEVYLFIKTMILQQKEKYAYGYKFNGNRMKAQKIMLPITQDKSINWQFMEDYIKSISNSHLL